MYDEVLRSYANKVSELPALDARDAKCIIEKSALCGDEVTLCRSTVNTVSVKVTGCLICKASTAILYETLERDGLEVAVAIARTLEGAMAGEHPVRSEFPSIQALISLQAYRSRHGCILLPWRALTHLTSS